MLQPHFRVWAICNPHSQSNMTTWFAYAFPCSPPHSSLCLIRKKIVWAGSGGVASTGAWQVPQIPSLTCSLGRLAMWFGCPPGWQLIKGHESFCFAWQNGLDVSPGSQLRSVGHQWWSGKIYRAKGPADVLMQGCHSELLHPRDVKP